MPVSILASTQIHTRPLMHIDQITEKITAQLKDPTIHQNNPTLATGTAGVLLLFATLQKKGWAVEHLVHGFVCKIKEQIEKNGIDNLSLYGGVSGICFALELASHNGTRYQPMLQTLQNFLLERIQTYYLDPFKDCMKGSLPVPTGLYDVIQGLAGIGRYMLQYLHTPRFYETVEEIIKILVHFSESKQVNGYLVPGWHLSATDTLNIRHQIDARGNFNLGLAHGITGVLSILASGAIRNILVPGQKEAIKRISTWIQNNSVASSKTIRWPYTVSWDEEIDKTRPKKHCRDAWCYGAPGIARALFLAAKALADDQLQQYACRAFNDIFTRSRIEWHLPGPMLCHGIAGLMMITSAMSQEQECTGLQTQVDLLKKMLLESHRPDAPYGFRDVEYTPAGELIEVDKAGFLEGTAGALLCLITVSDPQPEWLLPLLIYE